ncbi:hypothetical protein HKX48_004185 [Thoreauomyces humboldtii]|nr:hypothetical protein HKX48_004185 [Thoreauomyces humboldtii]
MGTNSPRQLEYLTAFYSGPKVPPTAPARSMARWSEDTIGILARFQKERGLRDHGLPALIGYAASSASVALVTYILNQFELPLALGNLPLEELVASCYRRAPHEGSVFDPTMHGAAQDVLIHLLDIPVVDPDPDAPRGKATAARYAIRHGMDREFEWLVPELAKGLLDRDAILKELSLAPPGYVCDMYGTHHMAILNGLSDMYNLRPCIPAILKARRLRSSQDLETLVRFLLNRVKYDPASDQQLLLRLLLTWSCDYSQFQWTTKVCSVSFVLDAEDPIFVEALR